MINSTFKITLDHKPLTIAELRKLEKTIENFLDEDFAQSAPTTDNKNITVNSVMLTSMADNKDY